LQAGYIIQDIGKLVGIAFFFIVAQFQARQIGNVINFFSA
jgi:hypothetical protein